MSGFERKSTEGGLQYLEAGGSEDVLLVFVHGYGDSGRGWQWAATPLAEAGHHIVLVDRKEELAIGNDSHRVLEAYAEQVIDVVGTVRRDDTKLILIGHSMGGPVAELAARRLGDAITGLILITPAPLGGVPLPEEVLQQFIAGASITDPAEAAAIKSGLTVTKGDEIQARLVESTPDQSAESLLQGLMAWVGGHPYGLESSDVDVPVLVIATEDQFFSEGLLRSAVAPRFAQSEVAVISGAGHYPHIEQPTEVAGHIERFVTQNT